MNVDAGFRPFRLHHRTRRLFLGSAGVRKHMMNVFKQNLAPPAFATSAIMRTRYSHTRNIARDMMMYHTRRLTGTKEKTGQAVAILNF